MQQKQSNLRDFDVISKLGQGSFGQVYKVKRKADGKQYALKKIRIGSMKPKDKENALNEVRILASYDHEFIIGYKEAFYDETSGTLCVIMQFAAGGDVLKINQNHTKARTKYKEEDIWIALVHMATGLKCLHDKKVLHRDLKCANVFVTGDKKYKLGDLNVSKVLKKDFACTQTGTPYYASPEVWKDQPYNLKSDMWSLGCVLYQMAALKPPFTAHDLSGLYKKICAGVFERIPYTYSNDLQAVISSLLKQEPKRRPDTEQLLNNPTVIRHFKGEIDSDAPELPNDDFLLQTIKFNPRDLKGLKNHLPKSNYEGQQKDQNNAPRSCRSIKKSQSTKNIKKETEVTAKSIQENENKLKEFLQRRRQQEEKERQSHLLKLKNENQQLVKRKERVLSACGVRQPHLYQSPTPRITVHKKDQVPMAPINSCKPNKKDESVPSARLPPKPQGMTPNYRIPPRPNHYVPSQPAPASNRSIAESRDNSKENLRNIGARLVSDNKPYGVPPSTPSRVGRSNSAQKVVYPCWWG